MIISFNTTSTQYPKSYSILAYCKTIIFIEIEQRLSWLKCCLEWCHHIKIQTPNTSYSLPATSCHHNVLKQSEYSLYIANDYLHNCKINHVKMMYNIVRRYMYQKWNIITFFNKTESLFLKKKYLHGFK